MASLQSSSGVPSLPAWRLGDDLAAAVTVTEATYTVTVAPSHLTQAWTDRRSVTWADLCRRLTDHRVGAKAGPCFTPATFRSTNRLKSEADEIAVAVLDLDDGARSLPEIKSALETRGWAGIIYSTHSHTPDHPKFRVVISLARPWRAADYPTQDAANAAWRDRVEALAAALSLHHDPACTDTSRLYYLPRHPEGAEYETAVIEGSPCDVWSLPTARVSPANDKPAPRPEASQIDGARLRYAAAALDGELAAVQSAREGTRNQTLNTAALKLGGLCAAGLLTEGAVRTTLTAAALAAGLAMPEVAATLNSGLRAGMAHPRDIPERAHQPRQHQGTAPHPEYDPETGEIYDHDPRPEPPPADDTQCQAPSAPEWPEPIPLGRDIPSAPAFPMAALPQVLADFVRDNAERMQAPPDLVAIPALVALAGCIGKDAVIRPKRRDDWQERACLWGNVIQPPGSMKSACVSKATSALRRVQAAWSEADAETRADWLGKKAEADLRVKAWEGECAKRLKANANATLPPKPHAAEALPPEPKPRRIVTSDATIEKLAELMVESRGMTLVRDELAGWLLNMARYNAGSDRQFYLEAYSGGSFSIDRIRRGEMVVPDLYINIIGGIQPSVARKLFDTGDGGDDGFLDRFGLIAYPDLPDDWTLVDRWPDAAVRKAFNAACDLLVTTDWANVLHMEEGSKPFVRFSPEAQDIFDDWLKAHMRALPATAESAIGGFMGKARGLLCRLALVLHLTSWASGVEPDAKTVSVATLGQALTLLETYLVPTWTRVMSAFGNMPATCGAHRIAKMIVDRRLSGIRVADITKQNWTGLRDRSAVLEALTVLMDHGWLAMPEKPVAGRNGRPSSTYTVNPGIFDMEASHG